MRQLATSVIASVNQTRMAWRRHWEYAARRRLRASRR